ncbi:hypothetical protein DPMN_086601 [Dreissena polymorpha]|uniref:Uncharacterized protein n=1 Tax=Dreissena polymorpha TaxID=45954 RepID=A0A9D4KQR3_DREPO|nr:hypothetical protein DPMN_086601 [Dreissena polymorpha]
MIGACVPVDTSEHRSLTTADLLSKLSLHTFHIPVLSLPRRTIEHLSKLARVRSHWVERVCRRVYNVSTGLLENSF